MSILLYDGSFEGWLSAVYDVYEHKFKDVKFEDQSCTQPLFYHKHIVATDEAKARRVWNGLLKHVSKGAVSNLYYAFLAELPDIEQTLLLYVQYAFSNLQSIETDYTKTFVLNVAQIARKVHREKHRMEAFVRFQLTKDELYYSIIQPDYNVLPLISNHFEKRYADQRWLIYDGKRKYVFIMILML